MDIMGNFVQNNFDFGPVVQNMSFKEKVYKWHTMGILRHNMDHKNLSLSMNCSSEQKRKFA